MKLVLSEQLSTVNGGAELDATESMLSTLGGGAVGGLAATGAYAKYPSLRRGAPMKFVGPGALMFGLEKGALLGFAVDLFHQGLRPNRKTP
jgi:hypothetical protein